MAECSWSGHSASILKSGGHSPAAGALYDISLRSYTASSRSNLALQHRTLIYRRSRAGTVARTVLGMAGMQGLDVVTERPVLIIRARQGLEAQNRELVLEMGAKQGLEAGDAANFQEKGRFFGCRAEFDVRFQERGPVLGSWQRCRRGSPAPLPGFCRRWTQCKSCEPSGRARAACIEWPALVSAGHGDREEKTEREKRKRELEERTGRDLLWQGPGWYFNVCLLQKIGNAYLPALECHIEQIKWAGRISVNKEFSMSLNELRKNIGDSLSSSL